MTSSREVEKWRRKDEVSGSNRILINKVSLTHAYNEYPECFQKMSYSNKTGRMKTECVDFMENTPHNGSDSLIIMQT